MLVPVPFLSTTTPTPIAAKQEGEGGIEKTAKSLVLSPSETHGGEPRMGKGETAVYSGVSGVQVLCGHTVFTGHSYFSCHSIGCLVSSRFLAKVPGFLAGSLQLGLQMFHWFAT